MINQTKSVQDFLHSRRSIPYKTLTAPAPDADQLATLLKAAARVPDHGKLEPWRFIILTDAALPRLAALATKRGAALNIDPDKLVNGAAAFANAPLIVAVIAAPLSSEKVPEIEQFYSAGAVCLSLLNIALASGWGANWLSGWASHDREFLTEGLGLGPDEHVAGFVHIGSRNTAPPERPRPDPDSLTTWVTA